MTSLVYLHLLKEYPMSIKPCLCVGRGADLLSVNGDGNLPYDICEHDATLDFIESEMAKRGDRPRTNG